MPVPLSDTPPEKLLEWESIQLFHDRARQVRPNFKSRGTTRPPLRVYAIDSKAGPSPSSSAPPMPRIWHPRQMLQRLQHRLEFLNATPDNNMPQRHSTLRVMLKWSYELLWPELRQFFAALSVFRGGGTPEAAAFTTNQPHAAHF
jgi:predicted ATPase